MVLHTDDFLPDEGDDASPTLVLLDASHRMVAAFPWEDRDAASLRMRDSVIALIEYQVDRHEPLPPALGTTVDPTALHWIEIGRAIPGSPAKTPPTPLKAIPTPRPTPTSQPESIQPTIRQPHARSAGAHEAAVDPA